MHHDAIPGFRPPRDPLAGAPPPGIWVIWHGPRAQALESLPDAGLYSPRVDGNLPALPPDFPPLPQGFRGARIAERGGRRWVVVPATQGQFAAVYLGGLDPAL